MIFGVSRSGRTSGRGPVFLTDRRARVELPTADLDPRSRRARLSYRRAVECFAHATEKLPRCVTAACTGKARLASRTAHKDD